MASPTGLSLLPCRSSVKPFWPGRLPEVAPKVIEGSQVIGGSQIIGGSMEKLVVLKFGLGSLETGFSVTLQIGPEAAQPHTEIMGSLPPVQDLSQGFNSWQSTYRRLNFAGRPLALPKTESRFATREDCETSALQLRDRLNTWLRSESFRPLRETWLEKLQPNDSLRIVIQTQDLQLQRLPWHLWELVERYAQAETVLSAPHYDRVEEPIRSTPGVKILALLGDRTGIDIDCDRQLLEALPQTKVTFLVEPPCSQLTDQLWQEPWQILFFAGHSASLGPEAVGKMAINPRESLTIGELKYGLRQAVARGLQLAIFNSCDGLGLAREFADLQIPQLIVMREPVPDRVAQAFLQYLLVALTEGLPLHLAMRQARERLQGLEQEFPCATWLPVLFQNLAQASPRWEGLLGTSPPVSPAPPKVQRFGLQRLKFQRLTKGAIATTFALSTLVTGATILIRRAGLLQPLELQAYDHLLGQRSVENRDPRILVVTVTEADVAAQTDRGQSSLSDAALEQLLGILQSHQPAVIGLDIYRDFPVNSRYPKLAQALSQTDNFVGVCRVQTEKTEAIAPPPELPADRLGFSDLMVDPDGVIRRQLLALTPPPTSSCSANFSINLQLALRYLATQGIMLEEQADQSWQLGQVHIQPLAAHVGGYQGTDAWGYQTLLNYRKHNSVEDFVDRLTLAQVLSGAFNPAVIRDRIVLIGTTAESFKDYSKTPYSTGEEDLAGVLLQAQMVSQIVSAAMEGRSLIWTLSLPQEILWILIWSLLAGGVALIFPQRQFQIIGLGASGLLLYGCCWLVMHQRSGWLPLVPGAMAIAGSGAIVIWRNTTSRS